KVTGGAVPGDAEEDLFGGSGVGDGGVPDPGGARGQLGRDPHQGGGVGADDAGDGPHLRVRQLPGGGRLGDQRQLVQGAGDARHWAAAIWPAMPSSPVSTSPSLMAWNGVGNGTPAPDIGFSSSPGV